MEEDAAAVRVELGTESVCNCATNRESGTCIAGRRRLLVLNLEHRQASCEGVNRGCGVLGIYFALNAMIKLTQPFQARPVGGCWFFVHPYLP